MPDDQISFTNEYGQKIYMSITSFPEGITFTENRPQGELDRSWTWLEVRKLVKLLTTAIAENEPKLVVDDEFRAKLK